MSPNTPATTPKKALAITNDLVKNDPGSHRNVQRIHVARNGHSHRDLGEFLQLDTDSCAFIPHQQCQPRRPWEPGYVSTGSRRSPKRDAFAFQPGPELFRPQLHGGQTKAGPHRCPQHLRVCQPGITREENHAAGAQRVSRPKQCSHVSGILNTIEHENRPALFHTEICHRPVRVLDNCHYTLRRVGIGKVRQLTMRYPLDSDSGLLQALAQPCSALRPLESRADDRPLENEVCPKRFLHEPHSFHHREGQAAAGAAAL